MATLEQLSQALKAADAAGNVEDARKLAGAIRQMQTAPQQPSAQPNDAGQWERNVLLPREVNKQTGESRWAVPGLVQGTMDAAADAFTLPHDVMTGEVDPMSDEGIARSAGFAATTMLPGTPGVGKAALRTFPKQSVVQPLPAGVASAGRGLIQSAARDAKGVTVAGAQDAARKGYKAAWGADTVIQPEDLQGLKTSFTDIATEEGLILPSGKMVDDFPRIRNAMSAMEEFTSAPLNMKSAKTFHRQLRRAAKSTDPEEAIIGSKMLDDFEEFLIERGGDVGPALKGAKSDWHVYKKGAAVEDAIATAYRRSKKTRGLGMDQALRNEFEKLVGNKKQMRFFSDAEREVLEQVVQGAPVANLMRFGGQFAPTGVVGTVLSALAGFNVGGILGSAAMLGGGAISRQGAKVATKGAANKALDYVLQKGGSKKPSGPLKPLPQVPGWGGLPLNMVGRGGVNTLVEDERDARGLNRDDLRRRLGPKLEA